MNSKYCTHALECEVCTTQWTEHSQQIPSVSDFKSSIWQCLFTKSCPNCKCPIQKGEGCSHMICEFCKFQFCWACRRERFGEHSPFTCLKNRIMPYIIGIPIFFALLWALDYHHIPLSAIDFTLDFTIGYCKPAYYESYRFLSLILEYKLINYLSSFLITNITIFSAGLALVFSLDLSTYEGYIGLLVSAIIALSSSTLLYWWFFNTSIVIIFIELVAVILCTCVGETLQEEEKISKVESGPLKNIKKRKKKEKRLLTIKKPEISNDFNKFEKLQTLFRRF
jgi:hypothetical protein